MTALSSSSAAPLRLLQALVCVLALFALAALANAAATPFNAAALLDQQLPPPPMRHSRMARMQQQMHQAAVAADNAADHSLLAVSTSTRASASASAAASLSAKLAAETALAVDERLLHSASVEDTLTAAGRLTASERALIDRMIPIPHTSIPSDPAKPLEYTAPPTRDALLSNLGPRGYPWPEKLQNALTTVENAAKQRIGEIKRQSTWSSAAQKLVGELGAKRHRVLQHVDKLTSEIKDLLKKKKQIENKKLQDALVQRLELTHNNLKKVRRQTHHIRRNQAKMLEQKEQLAHALEGIKRSLALLKGMKRERQFPVRGMAERMSDELAKFDPDLSFEKEATEVQRLRFPDAVLAQIGEQLKRAEEMHNAAQADAEE